MEVYLLSLDRIKNLPEQFGEAHFGKRMERARRFLRKEDYFRCVGAGALLYTVLGVKEEDITENRYHKPYIRNGDVHFNLSHSGKYVMLAKASAPVGADIEIIDSAHLSLAREVYLPEELTWMAQNPLSRFYTLWTLKESVMKQQGLGFYLPPQSFSVLPLLQSGSMQLNGTRLYAQTKEYDGHILAVCSASPVDGITIVLSGDNF